MMFRHCIAFCRAMSGRLTRLAAAGAALAALVGTGAGTASAGTAVTAGVIPPHASAYGASYSTWSVRWWQWAYRTPLRGADGQTNLLAAPTGTADSPAAVDCSYGQSGHVWFLSGTFQSTVSPGSSEPSFFANRRCTVPAGTALFLPLINAEWDNVSGDPAHPLGYSLTQLWQMVKADIDSVSSMSATIDGRSVRGLSVSGSPYRVQAGPFPYTLPEGNILGIPPETTPPPGAVGDGVYLMLAPLSVGAHVIHWTAEAAPPEFVRFNQDITYHLTVVPRSP